ncbi:MAG: MATE family efflux transporter [Ruminococcaceae bacterium]|nr:MATE family efflux transporter [Oscillospiraceae bacterium]
MNKTKDTSSDSKFIQMTTAPVEKLIIKLAVPTIISMLVTTFYNLADTLFVRQLENDSMVAAVGVVLPLMSIIQAFGFFCGHGSGNYISRAFGRKDYNDAKIMASTGFFYAVVFGLVITVGGLLFTDQLTFILGAKTEATSIATKEYMKWILIACPFMTGAIVINNQLRMQGNAFFAMVGLTTGAILNCILDPIFIFKSGDTIFNGSVTIPFGVGLGVEGAALATAISQVCSFILLFIGMYKSDAIKINLRSISLRYFSGIVQGGLPSLARQGLASVSTACLNHSVGLFISDEIMIDAVQAAMTGVSKITLFLSSALIGFGQGFQPVCGFNYGAKLYDRVIKSYFFCIKVACVALVIFSALGFIFSDAITLAIAGSTELSSAIASFTFKAQLIVFPLQAWSMLCNMMLQNIGMTFRATVVAMSRQGLAFIPIIFLLPLIIKLMGFDPLLGIETAQAVSDVVAFIISLPIGIGVINEMRRESVKQRSGTES